MSTTVEDSPPVGCRDFSGRTVVVNIHRVGVVHGVGVSSDRQEGGKRRVKSRVVTDEDRLI